MKAKQPTFVSPTKLQDVLKLLQRKSPQAVVLSGGTFLAKNQPSQASVVVDILRCGLEGIKIGKKKSRIGATTSAAQIAATEALDGVGLRILRQAAAAISGQAVRNQVTLGGNLVGAMTWSDMPVALLALDAQVELSRTSGKRLLSIQDFYATHPKKQFKKGELITGVDIPNLAKGSGASFLKSTRTVAEVALVNVATMLQIQSGVCKKARIAVGAAQPRPFRATQAEKLLEGKTIDASLINEAATVAQGQARVRADMRVSKSYRETLLFVLVQRALNEAVARAEGKNLPKMCRSVCPEPWTRKNASTDSSLIVTVDGTTQTWTIRPNDILLDVLRREGITSVKHGCDDGYCGACSVLVNGRLLNACLVIAAQVQGCDIVTAAGVGSIQHPHPIQTALVQEGAVQCGFCTPGWVVSTKALLDHVQDPNDQEICTGMDGNLCRCTGYVKPLNAIRKASKQLQQKRRR